MPKFAVHVEDANGQRYKIIEEHKTPEHASVAVASRLKQEKGPVIILKVKAMHGASAPA